MTSWTSGQTTTHSLSWRRRAVCFHWRKQPLTVSIDARSVRSTCVHAAIVNNEVSSVPAFHPGHRHRLITSGHNTLHVGAAPNWFFRLHAQPFTTAFHICDISLIFSLSDTIDPSSLLHDDVLCFDSHASRQKIIFVSHFHIAHVHGLFWVSFRIQRNVPIHLVLCFEQFQTFKINHFLLAVRIFFTKGDVCPFLQQRILPNRVLERRLDSNHQLMGTHEHVWVLFRSIKTSMESVILPNTLSLLLTLDQCAHLSSKHKASVSYDHLEVVHTLFVQVLILLNCLPKVVSRSIVSFQVLLRRLLLVTIEQQFCNLLRCHAFGFPKLSDLFGVPTSWSLLLQVWDLHDDDLLDFDCTDQTNHKLRHKSTTDYMPKVYEKMIVFVWVVLWKWTVCLPLLDLRSPVEKSSAQWNIGCEVSSNICVVCRAMRSHAPFGLFEHAIPYSSCPGPQKHQCLSLHCFVSSVTCCVCNICCLTVFLSTIYVVEHRQECDSAFEITRYRGFKQRLNVSHDLDSCVLGDIFRNLSFSILCNEFDHTKVPQAVSPHSLLRDHPFSSLLIHRFFFILTKSTNWLWFCRNLHMGHFSRSLRHVPVVTRCKDHKEAAKCALTNKVCQLNPTLLRKRTLGQHTSTLLGCVHIFNVSGFPKVDAITKQSRSTL